MTADQVASILCAYGFEPIPEVDEVTSMLGDLSLSDFSSLQQNDPLFANAWGDVNSQLQAEYQQAQVQYSPEALQQQAQAYASQGQAYVQQYYQQLQAQGAAQLQVYQSRIALAKVSLTNAYSTMVSNFQGLLASPGGPQAVADAAKNFVLLGQSVAGAVQTIEGLVQDFEAAASGGSFAATAQLYQQITGLLIGLSVAVGAVSAGVGAAIIGGIGAVLGLIGPLVTPAPAYTGPWVQLCYAGQYGSDVFLPQFLSGRTMKVTVGCIGGYVGPNDPAQVPPGSVDWRPFPNPANKTGPVWAAADGKRDADWFEIPNGALGPAFFWHRAFWGPGYYKQELDSRFMASQQVRPIDVAFPAYHLLETTTPVTADAGIAAAASPAFVNAFGGLTVVFGRQSTVAGAAASAYAGFQQAFFTAWKANQALALNGLKPLLDGQVLVQTARLWNTAHMPGTPLTITQSNTGPYVEQIVANAITFVNTQFGDPGFIYDAKADNGNGGIILHTGPKIAPPKATSIASLGTATGSTAGATAAKVAIGGGVLAGAAWFALGRPLSWAALKAALGGLFG